MLSLRPTSRSLAWCFALVTLMSLLPGIRPASVAAATPFDVRGTWEHVATFTNRPAPKIRHRWVIEEQSAAGTLSGALFDGRRKVTDIRGSVTGAELRLEFRPVGLPYRSVHIGELRPGKRLTASGEWSDNTGQRGTFTAKLVKPAKPVASAQGGTRPSATLVICSRDMTAASDQALLRCNALVTDASAQPGSRAPAGKVTWETEVGTLDPADCMLTSQGGTSSCVVALTGSREDLPIGSELPVTAFYAGDALYAPSDASHRLFGKATGFTESDQYGPDCNPAAVDYPSMTCGDPVNPATGNLSMTVADVGISGRGFALAVVRTYNAHAAADGAAGRFGIGWTDEHEGRIERAGKRVTVHLGTGATVPFQVKGKRFTAPGWVTASLTQGKRKGYLLTLSDQTRFTFDAQGRLTSFSDRNGEPIAITRAADGAILTAADSSGRTLTFERDGAGRVTTVTDPMGRSVAYVYDETGHLVSVTDVAGSVTRYAYDEQHRMTGITDQRGSTATTEYDADDRVVRQTDPLGNAITFEYAGTYPNGVTTITDGKGIRTAIEYRKGMPVSETHALGTDAPVLVKQLYDGDMRHVGTVDANGGLWRVTRDKSGNILTSTDPLGRTATMTWNDRNDPLSVTSPMGLRTDVEYDDKGLVTRVIKAVDTPDEAVTTVSRDDPEHPTDVTSITDPLGSVTRFGYDAAGHLVSITDPFGGVTRMEVNGLGWVMATTDPTRARTTLIRDARGQVTSITDPLGLLTTATWDPAGALSSVSDPMDSVTALVHDAAGRISGATLADGLTQDVARDELGDVIGRSDASGSVMTATYDPLRRVSSVADPLGNETRVAYDPAGNVLSTTNALGETTRFSWDAAHQLLAMDYDDATPDVTFTYDLDGRRTSMTDGTGTTTYEYDARDRIVSVTDGAGDTVGQSWDLRGALTGLAYPDGLSVTYAYDALGRMISVSDSVGGTSTFAYDAAGRLLESRLGDGSVTTRTYDARGSVLAIGGRPLDLVYARDPLGRVAAVTSGGQTVQTHHDVRGRLTSVGDETFEFDLAGALTSVRGATMTHDTAGRLVQMAGDADATTFTFDDAGRRIAQDGASPVEYAYDQVGRLTSVGESTWTYDGDGLRRSVTDADGVTAHFSWLTTGGRPMLLSDGTSRFIYGPGGMPLAQVGDGGARQWFHTDQAGSVRALTADDGSVVGTFAFDAYGLATDRTGTATTRLGFQGNYTEADSGLQYLLARVYDPGTAQFLTVDPLVWRTLEPYAFAAGDPLTYGDPTGLDVALAGHGEWNVTHGMTTVPEGTTVIFHAPAGWGITDDYGKLVEGGGSGGFEERFGPGSLIPNYLLSPPAGLSVLKSSRTVSSPTRLKDLLWPGQGNVSWAACRYMWGGSYDPASPEQTLHMWVREHGYSTVHASDYQALGGWGTDSQVIFGDTQLKKFGHFGGGYQIAEPVVLMPGV